MTEKILETRTCMVENVRLLDYSDYERRLQYIELRERIDRLDYMELRYNHNHDEKGRFCSGSGGGRLSSASEKKLYSNGGANPEKSVDKSKKSDTIEETPEQKQLKQMIENGEVSLQINANIQNRHYKGTSEYKTFSADGIEKSYFNVPQSELQQLLNEKAATGSVRIDSAGVAREIIDFGKNVGYDSKIKQETSFVKIHYSKRKTHMSPYTPNMNE